MARGVREIVALPDPVGRGDRRLALRQRPADAQGARAARRRRRRLRGAAERDDRRRRAVPEVRQRDPAARLVVGGALERRARERSRARRPRRTGCRPARWRSWPAAGARSSPSWPARRALVDLIIPRGGEGLKKALAAVAKVPVIYAASGNCHVYVDASADLDDAHAIILNAKTQRPGVCNAAETLLVHADVADAFLPGALSALHDAGVELRGDERTRAAAGGVPVAEPRPTTTTPRSSSRSCSRSASSTPPRRRSSTSTRTARATPRRSSPARSTPRGRSSSASTPRAST